MGQRFIEYMPIDEIPEALANPKNHDEAGIDASMERFGVSEPITLDERTGRLISGHGRLRGIRRARDAGRPIPDGVEMDDQGRWSAPVVRGWASKDDAEAQAHLIALNQLTINGGWDDRKLAESLRRLEAASDEHRDRLAGTGWNPQGLKELYKKIAREDAPKKIKGDPDHVPERAPAVTQPGDVWILGPHRRLCGDSTRPENVALLCADEPARIVCTDPPYGVSYVGGTPAAMTIANDGAGELYGLIVGMCRAATGSVMPGSPFYICCAAGPRGTDVRVAIRDVGWKHHETLVWVKDIFVLGHSDYHYRHEEIIAGSLPGHVDILYGWLQGPGRSGRGSGPDSRWFGGNNADSVIEVPRPSRSTEHPTMKPVELITRLLENSCEVGDVVLDLFGGSGSTLIACHMKGRRARLLELDPHYCDVIVERYRQATGDEPERIPAPVPVDEAAEEEKPLDLVP